MFHLEVQAPLCGLWCWGAGSPASAHLLRPTAAPQNERVVFVVVVVFCSGLVKEHWIFGGHPMGRPPQVGLLLPCPTSLASAPRKLLRPQTKMMAASGLPQSNNHELEHW